jgi:hypothetical protein
MKTSEIKSNLNKLRWNIQDPIEKGIAYFINKYNIKPYGYCPVQAEGCLPTGEFYYFRSRHSTWSVRISKTEESLWENSAWVYNESKYKGFEGGCIGKLEVVRNFNKATKLYYSNNEHSRIGGDTTEVSQHGVPGKATP